MKRKILLVSLFSTIIILGFVRDYVFVSINQHLDLGNKQFNELLSLKWILTPIFCVLYLVNSLTILKILFYRKIYLTLYTIVMSSFLFIAVLSGVVGYIFFSFESIYPFIRVILGVVQSPLILMIVLSGAIINERTTKYS